MRKIPGGASGKEPTFRCRRRKRCGFDPLIPVGQEDFLAEGMATHSSTLAWRIPWAEEPGRLQSTGSLYFGVKWLDTGWLLWEQMDEQEGPRITRCSEQGSGVGGGCRPQPALWSSRREERCAQHCQATSSPKLTPSSGKGGGVCSRASGQRGQNSMVIKIGRAHV